jgi:hypothetical protein
MRQERVLTLAEELAKKGDVAALRLLVRAAALPLMAEGMLDWADKKEKDLPRLLHLAIPRQVLEAMWLHKVRVQEGPPKGLTLDLATDTVISFPWNGERLRKSLERIGQVPWRYDPGNHEAFYHRPIGVAFFVNGLHSGAVGILKREGRLPATEIDLGPLYAAGFGIEWQGGVPLAVFRDKVVPMDHPHHALLLALGEVFHRHGVSL